MLALRLGCAFHLLQAYLLASSYQWEEQFNISVNMLAFVCTEFTNLIYCMTT